MSQSTEAGSTKAWTQASGRGHELRPTLLTTPGVGLLVRWISRLLLRLLGWRVVGSAPTTPRYVLVAAPHTSNWDAFYLVMMASVLRIPIRWLGKHTLFRFPFGGLMRWFGGIAVDRRRRGGQVARAARLFERFDHLVIVVPPEGTRARNDRWKTGFYYIATTAEVPVALGFLDYASKTGGVGPLFLPSGDLDADLPRIREFYADKTGLRQAMFGNAASDESSEAVREPGPGQESR
ncbi:MAG: glycerol acyltransferase [Acidobacteria bacterium]|nr:MAG: glycerol acyltransferase [Acidobacteriota bacterium]REK00538.1 MAG: glycerol acyltransferase [Acidobacteriota bacterium]